MRCVGYIARFCMSCAVPAEGVGVLFRVGVLCVVAQLLLSVSLAACSLLLKTSNLLATLAN